MTRIGFQALSIFTRKVLDGAGLDTFSNDAVATGLCETSLRGVDSHGIRLLPHYVDSALNGRKNPAPNMTLTQTFPAFGRLDADNAFGHAAGMKAIDHGMEMAETLGIGAIAVTNSSHPGAMASFALRAARQGFIAFAFTHADALVLSAGGQRSLFGTNPVCMAAPREEDEPYCLDMATSVISWNRLKIHRDSGEQLADGVAADGGGLPTQDADAANCLMPVGSPISGYKGYGLGSMVEVLCGVLTGMAFGRDIPAMYTTPMDQPRHLGQFYMVLRPDVAGTVENFRHRMQEMSNTARAEPAHAAEGVMLPGDPEIREAARRREHGIPMDDATVSAFCRLSEQFGVALELDSA
jgi:ureidoglycolate dehydrogenase (NAD+)